jgi:hypothetical protein
MRTPLEGKLEFRGVRESGRTTYYVLRGARRFPRLADIAKDKVVYLTLEGCYDQSCWAY